MQSKYTRTRYRLAEKMTYSPDFFYFSIIDEEEPITDPHIKSGTFDNGAGYILMWYISQQPIHNPKTIITLPYPKTMPRYILWDNDISDIELTPRHYTTEDYMLYKDRLMSEEEYWLMVDTEFVHTDNPVKFYSDDEDEAVSTSDDYTEYDDDDEDEDGYDSE